LWNSISQYNEEEYQIILDTLGIEDQELLNLIQEHRQNIIKDIYTRFKDAMSENAILNKD